ncbi:hypothetical protein DFP72DRAFT_63678 [Ephemerocybe angulata]|uniref:Uncharacterized protein n=1 Tax=Ephemerocybe angulata TaxID=980116 RepID=A0A8H6HE96_9AGAR|nr:hypothetical protein DFP72DRAFT_63678 [Tulosesus angulatus]
MYSWSWARTETRGFARHSTPSIEHPGQELVEWWAPQFPGAHIGDPAPPSHLQSTRIWLLACIMLGLLAHAPDSRRRRRMSLARMRNAEAPSSIPVPQSKQELSKVTPSALPVAILAERGVMGVRADEKDEDVRWDGHSVYAAVHLHPADLERAAVMKRCNYIRRRGESDYSSHTHSSLAQNEQTT